MADIKLKDRNDNETTYTGVSKLKVPAADGGEDVVFQLPPVRQEKAVTITENGTTSIVPDEGKDGLSKVNMTVDVPSSGAIPDWTQNDATAADYVKNRPGGYDVYSSELAATGSFAPAGSGLPIATVDFPDKFIVDGQRVTVKIENETFERTVQKVPDDKKVDPDSLAEYWIRLADGEGIQIGDNGWMFIFQLNSAGTWSKATVPVEPIVEKHLRCMRRLQRRYSFQLSMSITSSSSRRLLAAMARPARQTTLWRRFLRRTPQGRS